MLGENMRQCDLEYLLGNRDSKKRYRPSELIEGDLPSLLEARKIASKYKRPQIAFSYRDKKLTFEQVGGDDFEKRLKEDILNTFLPGIDRGQFHYAFIRHHNDDSGYELNFYMLQMTQGRQFTAYWHEKDVKLHQLLSRKIQQENPHLTSPWADEYEQLLYPAKKAFNPDSELIKTVQELLDEALKKKLIKSRKDFLEMLKARGYEISRSRKETFTVVFGKKRIRFAGQAAHEDFDPMNITRTPKVDNVDYASLWREACQRKHKQLINKYKFIKPYEKQSKRNDRQMEPFFYRMEKKILELNELAVPQKTRQQIEKKLAEVDEVLTGLRKILQSANAPSILQPTPLRSLSKEWLEIISKKILEMLPGKLLPELVPPLEEWLEEYLKTFSEKLSGHLDLNMKENKNLIVKTMGITDILIDEKYRHKDRERFAIIISYPRSDHKKVHIVFTGKDEDLWRGKGLLEDIAESLAIHRTCHWMANHEFDIFLT